MKRVKFSPHQSSIGQAHNLVAIIRALFFKFQASSTLNNQTVIPGRLPYEACLIPHIPQDVQHTLRNIANFVVIPVDMLLASLSLVCNLLVLAAVIRTRSLHHPSLLLLCSLSITDILWAIFTIVRNIETVTHEHLCPGKIQS